MAKTTRFLIKLIGISILITIIYFFIVSKVQVIQYTSLLQQRNELYSEYQVHYSNINTDTNLLNSNNSNTYALVLAGDMLEVDERLNALQLEPYYPEYTKLLERTDILRIEMHGAITEVIQSQDSLKAYLNLDSNASKCLSNVNLNGNNSTIVTELTDCVTKLNTLKSEIQVLESTEGIVLSLTKQYVENRIVYWNNVIELYKTESSNSTLSQLENELSVSKTSSEKELNDIVRLSSDIDLEQLIQDITYLQEQINNWIIEND